MCAKRTESDATGEIVVLSLNVSGCDPLVVDEGASVRVSGRKCSRLLAEGMMAALLGGMNEEHRMGTGASGQLLKHTDGWGYTDASAEQNHGLIIVAQNEIALRHVRKK